MKLYRRLTPEERRKMKAAMPDLAAEVDDDVLALAYWERSMKGDLHLGPTVSAGDPK
jgi:hypothetical protein